MSRTRAQRTRDRARKAGRDTLRSLPWRQNPLLGLVIALGLWAATVFLVRAEELLHGARSPETLFPLAGDAVFLLVSLLSTTLMLQIVRPEILRDNIRLSMLALTALIAVAVSKGIDYGIASWSTLSPATAQFLFPLALAPMLATILVDAAVGVAAGVWCSLAVCIVADHSLTVLIAGLVVCLVTAQSARNVRTRSKAARLGLIVGLCEVACVFGTTAMAWRTAEPMVVLNQAAACVVSGFFAAILALLILPLFETLFHVTTDITLLELSDLSHPLLQRLALEAPGTYHHSLILANLAAAAADEIGANSLVARVSAYFHDVGKLTTPDFFAENIRMRSNPHDDLPPSMSTLVIAAHVKEGLALAQHYKLPDVVRRVISEHHGTTVMSYFHHKAKTQVEEQAGAEGGNTAARVDDTPFRYPGPRPTSRESGIICLADAVEAASRSLEKTSPAHIEGLIQEITFARVRDGQLDDCDLTMADIARLRRAFAFTLTNMLHGRVPYPKDENRDKQPARFARAKRPEGPEPDAAADGERQPPGNGAPLG